MAMADDDMDRLQPRQHDADIVVGADGTFSLSATATVGQNFGAPSDQSIGGDAAEQTEAGAVPVFIACGCVRPAVQWTTWATDEENHGDDMAPGLRASRASETELRRHGDAGSDGNSMWPSRWPRHPGVTWVQSLLQAGHSVEDLSVPAEGLVILVFTAESRCPRRREDRRADGRRHGRRHGARGCSRDRLRRHEDPTATAWPSPGATLAAESCSAEQPWWRRGQLAGGWSS